MSRNVSENVELGQLTEQPQECYEDGHQEDECEKEDLKEGREEEMSLLGEEDGVSSPPVQIVTAARHSPAPQSIPVLPPAPPQPVHQPHLATPDPDIQLAESECGKGSVQAVHRSSIHSVCGPKPAKLTIICLVLLSIWAMVVLIVHLDRKVSDVSSSLALTEDKLRSMEDTADSYRHQTSARLQSLQTRIGEILRGARTGVHSKAGKNPKMPSAVSTAASPAVSTQTATVTTKHTTEQDKTEEQVEEDFFGDGPAPSTTLCTGSGQPCVFPFLYQGVARTVCVQEWTDVRQWCATRLDSQGGFVDSSDAWGYCTQC
eukprot:GFUD01104354.1.p1 GENE.GFUD01104354.1~~GFUD01104354.1.p1  ORF type:complete len:317 (-),score=126.24 GFUD01104354.1:63-1013(-)